MILRCAGWPQGSPTPIFISSATATRLAPDRWVGMGGGCLRAADGSRHGIVAGPVVCYEVDGIDPGNNAYVRELARTRPWISSLAFSDPNRRRIGPTGSKNCSPPGISASPPACWSRPRPRRFVTGRRRFGRGSAAPMPYVSFNARPEAIARLQPLVDRAIDCASLFSHLGLPGRSRRMSTSSRRRNRLDPLLLALASRPNVGVEISGLCVIDLIPPHAGARPFVEIASLRAARRPTPHWDRISVRRPALFPSRRLRRSRRGVARRLADRNMVFGETRSRCRARPAARQAGL